MSQVPNLAGAAVVVVGVAVQVDAVAAALSRFFAVALPVIGGVLLLVWLVREAWDAVQDWRALGPPDLGPWRRKRDTEREEVRGR